MNGQLLLIFMEKLRHSAVLAGRDVILVSDVEYAIAAVEESLAEHGINAAMLKDQP